MAPFPQTTLMAHQIGPGRPSEYRPEYCEAVIDYMSRGYSLTAFAGSIRVSRESVYEWTRAHREFSDAVSRARSARVAALEIGLLQSKKGAQTSARIFALKNADPTEWRDIRHTEHAHTVGIEKLTMAQLHAIAAGHSADGATIEGDAVRLGDRAQQANEHKPVAPSDDHQ